MDECVSISWAAEHRLEVGRMDECVSISWAAEHRLEVGRMDECVCVHKCIVCGWRLGEWMSVCVYTNASCVCANEELHHSYSRERRQEEIEYTCVHVKMKR